MDIQAALSSLLAEEGRVNETAAVGGGCISEASCVVWVPENSGPKRLFVKRNVASFAENFRAEWDGLVRLSESSTIGVPRPLAVGEAQGAAWLVIEWIERGGRDRDFFSRFGRQLAALHQATLGDRIGLDRDNFLGSARQINATCDDWVEFVATHRIGFQIGWASDQGLASHRLQNDCDQILGRLAELLSGREERTSLLHGDLWSGNYLSADGGRPFVIDPAIYYGCREAEFGMLQLFGACPADFYDAYQSAFSMPDGWQRRVKVYVLYHLLNHLNLFGSGYLGQCESTAAEILRGGG